MKDDGFGQTPLPFPVDNKMVLEDVELGKPLAWPALQVVNKPGKKCAKSPEVKRAGNVTFKDKQMELEQAATPSLQVKAKYSA